MPKQRYWQNRELPLSGKIAQLVSFFFQVHLFKCLARIGRISQSSRLGLQGRTAPQGLGIVEGVAYIGGDVPQSHLVVVSSAQSVELLYINPEVVGSSALLNLSLFIPIHLWFIAWWLFKLSYNCHIIWRICNHILIYLDRSKRFKLLTQWGAECFELWTGFSEQVIFVCHNIDNTWFLVLILYWQRCFWWALFTNYGFFTISLARS